MGVEVLFQVRLNIKLYGASKTRVTVTVVSAFAVGAAFSGDPFEGVETA